MLEVGEQEDDAGTGERQNSGRDGHASRWVDGPQGQQSYTQSTQRRCRGLSTTGKMN